MSLLSSIGKGIMGAVTGFASGGPVGAVAGAAMGTGIFGGGGATGPAAPAPIFNQPSLGGNINLPGIISATGGITLGGQKTTTTGYSGGVQWTGGSPAPGGGCPRGYHLNKHALPASRRHGATGPKTICVRNRHVNALNGRAASRALRRLKRANKMTRKIHALFHHPARKPARKR